MGKTKQGGCCVWALVIVVVAMVMLFMWVDSEEDTTDVTVDVPGIAQEQENTDEAEGEEDFWSWLSDEDEEEVSDGAQDHSGGSHNGVSLYEENGHTSVYNEILEGALDHELEIALSNREDLDADAIFNEYDLVLNDHPELFWLTGDAELQDWDDYSIELDSRCDMDDIPWMEEQLNDVVSQLVELANEKCTTPKEKALFVHDAIIQNCSYDDDAAEKLDSDPTDGESMSFSAYGCLIDDLAVCEGYARGFELVMNELGIECGYVPGEAWDESGSGPHAWNYVKVDGEYYLIDVTWDDPDDGTMDCDRAYFWLSPKKMAKDHTPDDTWEIPW